MYAQAATTAMLASTTTATDDSSWSLLTLTFGLFLVFVGLTWVLRIASSDTPAPGSDSRRTQVIIGNAVTVIGLLIAMAAIVL